jgi:CheY-like chemotaxis protein
MTAEETVFLVVDDDATARDTVAQYLKSSGYKTVIEVADGEQAIAFVQSARVDFIVSDWDMPKMNGLALLKALKADPKFARIPFLMITSPISTEKLKVADAAAAGVDGYLMKPFRKRTLTQKIAEVLFLRKLDETRGVLVVDDDDEVRGFIAQALAQVGYGPVFVAKDGEEGFTSLCVNAPRIALVLSDWEMPKLSGIEFLRKVRTTRELRYTPFIMVTAQTSEEQKKVRTALEAQVDNYLMKPFRLEDLKLKVDQVFDRAKLEATKRFGLECAATAIREKEPEEAEKILGWVLGVDGENVEAMMGMAQLRYASGSPKARDEAVKWLERAIKLEPSNAQAHLLLAEVHEASMAVEKAIASLRSGVASCHATPAIHFNLSKLLLRRGRFEEGNKELERTLELDPQHAGAQELLGLQRANAASGKGSGDPGERG